jgi:hypothetical protein
MSDSPSRQDKPVGFICKTCGLVFRTPWQLVRHILEVRRGEAAP